MPPKPAAQLKSTSTLKASKKTFGSKATRRLISPISTQRKRKSEDEPVSQPPLIDLFDKMVNVCVKPKEGEAVVFPVYKGLLRLHSPFFNRLCAADKNAVLFELVDQDPSLFNYFVQWMIAEKYEFVVGNHWPNPTKRLAYRSLIDLWLLAKVLEVPQFANAVIADILNEFQQDPFRIHWSVIEYVYTRTKDDVGSQQIRRPFVYTYARHTGKSFTGEEIRKTSQPEFFADVLNRLVELRTKSKDEPLDPKWFRFKKVAKAVEVVMPVQVTTVADDDVQFICDRPVERSNSPLLQPKAERS